MITSEHIKYLDKLRDSGVTNMWGAGVYLERRFKVNENKSGKILLGWMHSFVKDGTDDSIESRLDLANKYAEGLK